jgi:TrmH family RNA methyltransferase
MTSQQTITSRSNARIKGAVALRDRAERDARGLTIVDGIRELARALDAGASVAEAFVCPRLVDTPEAASLLGSLRAADVPTTEVGEHVFARLAYGDRVEGIVGIVRVPAIGLDRLAIGPDALVVVLEGVEKPGNLGAVLRSADGAGADAVIVADPGTDPYNPNVIRASLGTVFSVPVAVASGSDIRDWLAAHAIRAIAARVDATLAYTSADMTGPTALILGSEARGLSDAWSGPEVTAVRVPMHGAADSLNVSVTAAILLYEARRQRDEGDDR